MLPNQVRVAPPVSPKQITDGLSKTMCSAEITGRGYNDTKLQFRGTWAGGNNVVAISEGVNDDPSIAWVSDEIFSDHVSGANGLYCDGSVHFLGTMVAKEILWALVSRDGSENIPPDMLK